jgi:hypothetical protein
MKYFSLFALSSLLIIVGCSDAPHKGSTSDSSEESTEGWGSLFDGKSLEGWRGYNGANIEGVWKVEADGVLHLAGRAKSSPHVSIITDAEYGDFDLRFEWKVEEGANSGVKFRVGEGPKQPYLTGPEYQILDNQGFRTSKDLPIGPIEHSASHYAIEAAVSDETKPIGEWNEGRILAQENHVEYWLNGVKTAEYEMHIPKWKEQVANTKFSKLKDFATLKRGTSAFRITVTECGFAI